MSAVRRMYDDRNLHNSSVSAGCIPILSLNPWRLFLRRPKNRVFTVSIHTCFCDNYQYVTGASFSHFCSHEIEGTFVSSLDHSTIVDSS